MAFDSGTHRLLTFVAASWLFREGLLSERGWLGICFLLVAWEAVRWVGSRLIGDRDGSR